MKDNIILAGFALLFVAGLYTLLYFAPPVSW